MRLLAKGLSKRYFRSREGANNFFAVKNADFALEPGKITALHGRSGGGKSTLLQMLSGLLTPTEGEVLADGESLYRMDDAALSRFRNAHFGVIPQGQAALAALSVLENVLLPLRLYDHYAEEDAQRAQALLERLDIARLSAVSPSELSGGEMRRMSIARALITRPSALFADEPTGDLDDDNARAALTLLKEAAAEGCAVLLVTHDPEALAVADEIWRMDAGVLTKEA